MSARILGVFGEVPIPESPKPVLKGRRGEVIPVAELAMPYRSVARALARLQAEQDRDDAREPIVEGVS